MIHLTMIARVYDGLPLTASLQDENLTEYQNKGLNSKFSLIQRVVTSVHYGPETIKVSQSLKLNQIFQPKQFFVS